MTSHIPCWFLLTSVTMIIKVFQKQKRKKHMKRLSLVTQFKIEFLLPFASCRNDVGKMPIQVDNKLRIFSQFLLFNLLIMVFCPLSNGVIEPSSKLFRIADGKFGQTGGGKNGEEESKVLTVYLLLFTVDFIVFAYMSNHYKFFL